MLLVQTIYWLHWTLDILFVAACLSVIFRPYLLARLYVMAFLGQQLILNGCLMTWLQNTANHAAGLPTKQNMFIMAEVVSSPLVNFYKLLFLIIAVWQAFYIYKEIKLWVQSKKAA